MVLNGRDLPTISYSHEPFTLEMESHDITRLNEMHHPRGDHSIEEGDHDRISIVVNGRDLTTHSLSLTPFMHEPETHDMTREGDLHHPRDDHSIEEGDHDRIALVVNGRDLIIHSLPIASIKDAANTDVVTREGDLHFPVGKESIKVGPHSDIS